MAETKTIIIMSVIVIMMTLLGYVGGLMSHNIGLYRQAQEECYDWLEEECPCIFSQQETPSFPLLNFNWSSGGELNVSIQEES